MLIWALAFGILCGATAGLFALAAGAGVLLALAAYCLAGSLGLLAMALFWKGDY